MINTLIKFSVKNKLIVYLITLLIVVFGIYSISQIPIGAVPDITNNQVQVITTSRNLSTLDVEQFLTYPIELEMANLPGVKEIRSVSKFGLSVVTIVFEDEMGTFLPRQLIAEKIKSASEKIPQEFGQPEMGPITTGLGEIYQYTLETKPGYKDRYSIMDLRTIQDWLVRRQLSGVQGVVEVNTWGGFLKQYEVSVDPEKIKSLKITLADVYQALEDNNDNTGGSYIEKSAESYFVRGEGMIHSLDDIRKIVIKHREVPILIEDVAEVNFGHAVRFGAITGNGEGEKVMGQIMMLKNANSLQVIDAVKERMAAIEKTLPEGIYINGFLERKELINKTTHTVSENLILGALIVIFVLVLLMGNVRSGLIVASVIPISLMFGLSLMYIFGVDVNLMSLGAIDFGILVDGAVIIVEFIVLQIAHKQSQLHLLKGQSLQEEKDQIAINSSSRMMKSAIFGQIIILIVFIPILSLTGVEGKMFRPMALSFSFILLGAMFLCLTYVPAISAAFLKPPKEDSKTLADRIMNILHKLYDPAINFALNNRTTVIASSLILLTSTVIVFRNMGGEFIPTLDEGDYVIQPILKPGTSLSETIKINTKIEEILLKEFPEVEQVITRIGAAEIPTDPMSMEMSDVIVILKDRSEWTSAKTKVALADEMKEALSVLPGVVLEFTQPIEMRFNELITGVRADLAIKIFGEDLNILYQKGTEIKNLIAGVPGASDISVEQIVGLPQMSIVYDRNRIAKYGLNIRQVNDLVRMAFAGISAGSVFEGERRFDLVVRLNETARNDLSTLSNLHIGLPTGEQIPISEIAEIKYETGPAQISRDDTKRRIVVSVNVRNSDLESVVDEVSSIVDNNIELPDGYSISYGGQFENLRNAKQRLTLAVPIALLLIFIMLYFTFNSIKQAALIFTAIPLAAIGGVFFLYVRGMPFSISAGVGFIALFGIAVLNGIILISFFNELKYTEKIKNTKERILKGTKLRLRPVILTAATAIMGFFPMAFSTSAGAEVQRPLATVVIGGLFTSTFLTLIVLPVVYYIFDGRSFLGKRKTKKSVAAVSTCLILVAFGLQPAQAQDDTEVSLAEAIEIAMENNAFIKASKLQIEQQQKLQQTSFDPGRMQLFYTNEEDNLDLEKDGIQSIGIQQNLEFPTVYFSNKAINKQKVLNQQHLFEMNENEIALEVSKAYYQYVFQRQKLKLYRQLDSLYNSFAVAASRKFELGETGLLEKITAETRLAEIEALQKQLIQELNYTHSVLNSYLQVEEAVVPSLDTLGKVNLEAYDQESKLAAHPGVVYYRGLQNLSLEQLQLNRNQLLPGFNLQYFRQTINNQSGFFGFQVGLNIPIWFWPQSARIQSAKIEAEISASQSDNFFQQIKAKHKQLQALLEKYDEYVQYYENQGLQMANRLTSVAEKSYREGETDYIQYLQGIEKALEIRLSYLENLNLYNQVIFELKYLKL